MKITQEAQEVADRTANAYSFDRYKNWRGVAQALLNYGLTERQAEAVMRSKWMRWAADSDESGATYGNHTSAAILVFLNKTPMVDLLGEVKKLEFETFGGPNDD